MFYVTEAVPESDPAFAELVGVRFSRIPSGWKTRFGCGHDVLGLAQSAQGVFLAFRFS
jgi:hypothetical protein